MKKAPIQAMRWSSPWAFDGYSAALLSSTVFQSFASVVGSHPAGKEFIEKAVDHRNQSNRDLISDFEKVFAGDIKEDSTFILKYEVMYLPLL